MRSPDKSRWLNAIRHVQTDEIPFFERGADPVIISKLLGRDIPMFFAGEMPADIAVAYTLEMCNDMFNFMDIWQLGRKTKLDSEGRTHYIDGTIKTKSDLKDITYPDIGRVKKRLESLLEAIDGTGIGVQYVMNCTPFVVTTAIGYEDYYMKLLTDPGFIHEFQKRVLVYSLQELELATSYPIDLVELTTVISNKTGSMLSREMIEEFEFPFLRQFVKLIKDKGFPAGLHTDGDITALIPDFIEMGFDILNPIEPCNNQDIYEIKAEFGDRIALQGNIDMNLLTDGTPGKVEIDVLDHIEKLGVGGGYICASSHNLTQDMPLKNIYAMRDTACSYHRNN